MIKSKDAFLKEIVVLPELSDNIIALVFADNPDIDISSREKFFDNIFSYFKRFKTNKPDITKYKSENKTTALDTWTNKDLRIKTVRLKSVRGYPESEIPFGIDFTNAEGAPQSMIILGGNATGKSSIYDAIEYSYCNSIGEALLRAYKQGSDDDVKFKDFLKHFDNSVNSIYCKVQTVTDTLDIQKENIPFSVREKINPDTHFISDYDIYSKGQLDYEENSQRSFHNTIAESLGLTELLEFEKNLKTFSLYKRQTESRNISALKRSNDNQQKLIETNEAGVKERKLRLEQLQEAQKSNPDENNLRELLEKLNQVKSFNASFSFDSAQFIISIENFSKAYSDLISKEIKNAGLNEIQFLNLGIELLKEHDNCPFCDSSKLLKDEIANSVTQRIAKIKELNESTQNLNKTLNSITDFLVNFKSQVDLIRNKVGKEIAIIQDKVEFNELSQSENDFLTYVSQLTAHDFYTEISRLDENPNYLKAKDKYLFDLLNRNGTYINKELSDFIENISVFPAKRLSIIQKIELSIADKAQPKSITEQVIETKKEISDLEIQISEAKKNIERDNKKINELLELQISFDAVKEETVAYLKVIHNSLNKEVEKAFAPVKLVVEEILETYFKADNREVDIVISKQPEDVDEETGEVLSEIITAHIIHKTQKVPPQPVAKYLNTFHYRLFSTMVGISIAIASRINTKINLPLVLDDIFYASDFENRVTIENFLNEIIKAFKTYTPDLPLQLILFTHDQLIFESAIKVIKESNSKDISFAKLFPYKEAKSENNYLNLVYIFPEYFPQTIMNSSFYKV